MKEQLEQRLAELKSQFESGRKVLADLEAQEANLRHTMLRISGAIEVLEEELSKVAGAASGQDAPEVPRTADAVLSANAAM
jgi:uncharacterized coiled-coil protein SlyX